jgi:hypothetical protein
VFFLVSIIATASRNPLIFWVSLGGALAGLLLIAACAVSFSSARARAIRENRRIMPLFFGFGRLVLWEANEGLVFLKNKRVSDVIYGQKDGGGTAIIYPILGEEFCIHVPLTFRPCEFSDYRVVCKEGVHLYVRLTFWWRILDERGLEKFYLVVDREIHKATETDREQILIPEPRKVGRLSRRTPDREPKSEHHAAEIWIRKIVESCTRTLVSGATAVSLVQFTRPHGDPVAAAPDVLSAELRDMVQNQIERYGLYVDRIDIQEAQLPVELQNDIHDLWLKRLEFPRTELEAEQRYVMIKRSLEAVSDVIGADAVAVQKILGSVRTNSFYGGLPPQLEELLAPFVKTLASRMGASQASQVPRP